MAPGFIQLGLGGGISLLLRTLQFGLSCKKIVSFWLGRGCPHSWLKVILVEDALVLS